MYCGLFVIGFLSSERRQNSGSLLRGLGITSLTLVGSPDYLVAEEPRPVICPTAVTTICPTSVHIDKYCLPYFGGTVELRRGGTNTQLHIHVL